MAVTHCAPSVFLHAIDPTYGNDMLTEYLYEIERKLDYGHWYLGHYHVDQGSAGRMPRSSMTGS